MKKQGFTLIEVVVSIVLVSIVMISLLSSLLQLRSTYSVIHEDSDIIVYSSSISRVINNDIAKNNGIRYISCNIEKTNCDLILGNDSRRVLEISKEEISDPVDTTHQNIKTTLRYINNTDKNNKELVYIRTLELDRYSKDGKVNTKGYNFLDINPIQYEHYNDESKTMIDTYTRITIRLYNGVDEDISKYNVILYAAGRYDYSHLVGATYTIVLDSGSADIVPVESIDEVFGVGFFKNREEHSVGNMIAHIDVPKKTSGEEKAFLGYFYTNGSQEVQVIDAGGNIVANNRFFKENINAPTSDNPEENLKRVYAKWGRCTGGYKEENGECIPKDCTITLDRNNGVGGISSYTVKYAHRVRNLDDYTKNPSELPKRGGYLFNGYYLESDNTLRYHTSYGVGLPIHTYLDASGTSCNTTIVADWKACKVGEYSLENQVTCNKCAVGSYTSSQATTRCTACGSSSATAGKTTSANGLGSCDIPCPNNFKAASWLETSWNDNNTINNYCAISTCTTGYHIYPLGTPQANNKCDPNPYTIVFNGNGNTGGNTANASCTYDSQCTLTANGFTKTGYSFAGWARTPNGSVEFTNNGKALNLTSEYNGSVTLYAKWKDETAPTVKVTVYKKNTSTIIGSSQTFTPNASQNAYTGTYTVNGGNWYGSQQTIKFEVSDNERVTKVMWRANSSGSATDTGTSYPGSLTDVTSTMSSNIVNRDITQDGYRKIEYQFSDAIGNKSTITVVSKIDMTKPTVSYSEVNDKGTKDSATVVATCSDTFSGVKSGTKTVTLDSAGGTVSGTCVDNVNNSSDYSKKYEWSVNKDACGRTSKTCTRTGTCTGTRTVQCYESTSSTHELCSPHCCTGANYGAVHPDWNCQWKPNCPECYGGYFDCGTESYTYDCDENYDCSYDNTCWHE